MVTTAQRQPIDQFRFAEEPGGATNRPEEMPGEAQLGDVLSRALIQHIRTMRAVGYEEEIVLNGEVWHVEVTRKSPAR